MLGTVVQADPLGLLVAFGAGMLSFLSPCVLPLVPAYLSMVSGLSAAELAALDPAARPRTVRVAVPARVPVGVGAGSGTAGAPTAGAPTPDALADPLPTAALAGPGEADPAAASARWAARRRVVWGMLAFIGGFTVVFVALGASASVVGRALLTHQRALETASGVLIVAFGAILVALAAGLTLPASITGERRFVVRPSMLGAWAPPIMGMAFAFAWTPCIGPVLGSVLTLAAGTGGSATGGIALLFAYSLGIGVPFFLCGLAFGRMTGLLARVRSRLRWVDLVGGVVLVAFGLLLLTGHVSVLSDTISGWLRDLHLDRLSTS